jgi:hypothetical protein
MNFFCQIQIKIQMEKNWQMKKNHALTNKFSNEKSCAISQFHKWKKIMHGPTILQMKKSCN